MKVTVVCYGPLRDLIPRDEPGRRLPLEVQEPATVADVAAALGVTGRLALVLVDGERARASDPVHEGSEITLMPPFSGGTTL